MKLLALVPARGGSKRVPNKNIKELGGKPLISWTIGAAVGVPEIVDVLVSTDSLAIAQVAKASGALVPWLRPAELASDTATSMDVCIHAIDWYENEKGLVDGIILLQPTSPFRTTATIQRGIELFDKSPHRPVVSFSPATSHPMWCYQITDTGIKPFIAGSEKPTRSQDLPEAYMLNGALYIANSKYLRQHRSFIGDGTQPLVIDDGKESLDIDTEWDWKLAEYLSGIG
jgi:CMP-N-acetylneuraminic acid synthetase